MSLSNEVTASSGTSKSDNQFRSHMSSVGQDVSDSYGALFQQPAPAASSMSENLQELLASGLSGYSAASPESFTSMADSNPYPLIKNDSLLNALEGSIIPLPGIDKSNPIAIETAHPNEYDEIKAFLRWNSEPEIPIQLGCNSIYTTTESSNSASQQDDSDLGMNSSDSASMTTFNSSLSFLPSPPNTTSPADNATISTMNPTPYMSMNLPFTYDPSGLSTFDGSLSNASASIHESYLSYEEPPYNMTLHGFELMTEGDQAFYGYSDAAAAMVYGGYCEPMVAYQGCPPPAGHAANAAAAQMHMQQMHMQQLQQQQQQQHGGHAFRWAAAAHALQPMSHVSMSMIEAQEGQAWPQIAQSMPMQQQQVIALAVPVKASKGAQKKVGASVSRASSQRGGTPAFSPYKKTGGGSKGNSVSSAPMVNTAKGAAFGTKLSQPSAPRTFPHAPTKIVQIQQLESQQHWFKSQIAQHADMQKKAGAEHETMIATLMRLAGREVKVDK
ncbi:hypothetical protein BC830DRAFT_1127470 [Chytriomyces sp. MP71]|nr:hypothetical protein BC830DRAFT_1127470 [Chytriomyces sp. MP71]